MKEKTLYFVVKATVQVNDDELADDGYELSSIVSSIVDYECKLDDEDFKITETEMLEAFTRRPFPKQIG